MASYLLDIPFHSSVIWGLDNAHLWYTIPIYFLPKRAEMLKCRHQISQLLENDNWFPDSTLLNCFNSSIPFFLFSAVNEFRVHFLNLSPPFGFLGRIPLCYFYNSAISSKFNFFGAYDQRFIRTRSKIEKSQFFFGTSYNFQVFKCKRKWSYLFVSGLWIHKEHTSLLFSLFVV